MQQDFVHSGTSTVLTIRKKRVSEALAKFKCLLDGEYSNDPTTVLNEVNSNEDLLDAFIVETESAISLFEEQEKARNQATELLKQLETENDF